MATTHTEDAKTKMREIMERSTLSRGIKRKAVMISSFNAEGMNRMLKDTYGSKTASSNLYHNAGQLYRVENEGRFNMQALTLGKKYELPTFLSYQGLRTVGGALVAVLVKESDYHNKMHTFADLDVEYCLTNNSVYTNELTRSISAKKSQGEAVHIHLLVYMRNKMYVYAGKRVVADIHGGSMTLRLV